MKTVLLIGVGRFGRHIAMKLSDLGHQIMAVDRARKAPAPQRLQPMIRFFLSAFHRMLSTTPAASTTAPATIRSFR